MARIRREVSAKRCELHRLHRPKTRQSKWITALEGCSIGSRIRLVQLHSNSWSGVLLHVPFSHLIEELQSMPREVFGTKRDWFRPTERDCQTRVVRKSPLSTKQVSTESLPGLIHRNTSCNILFTTTCHGGSGAYVYIYGPTIHNHIYVYIYICTWSQKSYQATATVSLCRKH